MCKVLYFSDVRAEGTMYNNVIVMAMNITPLHFKVEGALYQSSAGFLACLAQIKCSQIIQKNLSSKS